MGRRSSKTVKPMPEQTSQLGVRVRVATNLLQGLLSLPHIPTVIPADIPVVRPTSPSCSRQSPPGSFTSPQLPPAPRSPSSASWPSSASSPASPASSSSLPSTWSWPPLSSASSFLYPLCALFLLLPCLHRLHVRGQPLGNWGVHFTGANAAWGQHQNHNHRH